MQDDSLRRLEHKAWTSYFEDGFWDILIGLIMLITGIRGLVDVGWISLLVLPAVLVGPLGKRFITIPRIGIVKFGQVRKSRQKQLIALLTVSIIVMVGVFWLSRSDVAQSQAVTSPVVAIWIVLTFAVITYLLDFSRLYIYGLLFGLSEILWGLFDKPTGPIAFTLSGLIALMVGAFMLGRFLRAYTQMKREA